MQITEDIIERFLANRCTAEEAEYVAAYLETHPDVAKNYLHAAWNESDQPEGLNSAYSQEMLTVILSQTRIRHKFSTIAIACMGIAASLLILIGFVWVKQSGQLSFTNQVAAWNRSYSVPPEWKFIINNEKVTKREVLADGSVVILSPNASLRYMAGFAEDRRDLFLTGEALFEVAKDKSRPFTVSQGQFSTTALGTVFRMKENNGNYQIKLYEGKIVIKAREVRGWKADVFLKAGQQLEFNTGNHMLAVNHFMSPKTKVQKNNGSRNYTDLEFVNKPLHQVLDKLAEQFRLPIEYDKSALEHLYFSGKVFKNDSPETILKVIATMNDLRIVPKGNGFVVNKTQ